MNIATAAVSVLVISTIVFFLSLWIIIISRRQVHYMRTKIEQLNKALYYYQDVQEEHMRAHHKNEDRIRAFTASITPNDSVTDLVDKFTVLAQVDMYSGITKSTRRLTRYLEDVVNKS